LSASEKLFETQAALTTIWVWQGQFPSCCAADCARSVAASQSGWATSAEECAGIAFP